MIDWKTVYKLSAREFSEDPNEHAEPKLIYSLGFLRKLTNEKMFPSPAPGALARMEGRNSSQHFAVGRKSTASDVFCEGIPIANVFSILSSKWFNGVGIYIDTIGPDGLPWIMFHLDLRPIGFDTETPLIWITEKEYDFKKGKTVTKYRYPQSDPKYWKLLNNPKFFREKN